MYIFLHLVLAVALKKTNRDRFNKLLETNDALQAFAEYRVILGKNYTNNAEKLAARKEFMSQFALVQSENSKNSNFKLSLNKFSDWPKERLKRLFGFINISYRDGGEEFDDNPTVADELDWSAGDTNVLPPVKDQGSCGSCWAFTVQSTIESHLKINHKDLVALSEQNLVSCDTTNSGCNGGNMNKAYNWIKENGGVCSAHSYPYSAKDESCSLPCDGGYIAKINGYQYISSEASLKRALNVGPVAAGVQSSSDIFQAYSEGIIDHSACGTDVDHAVTVVGYGTENGVDYWKIRNSWGPDWGEDGYFRIKRGENICGISAMLSMPTGTSFLRDPSPEESAYIASSRALGVFVPLITLIISIMQY